MSTLKIFIKVSFGFFLFYVALLRLQKKTLSSRLKWPKQKWILGHRGARANAPENTLSAFKKAIEYGADGVEFDVFLSSDGIPVVIHDKTVDRTTDGHGAVEDLSAGTLAQLNAAKEFLGFTKEGVPTLLQVLESMPAGAVINVELKGSGRFSKQVFVKKLMPILKQHEQRLTLIISSFDGELLYYFRSQAPDYLVSLLLSPVDENWPKAIGYMDAIAPDALHLPAQLVGPLVLNFAKRVHVHVAIWTVNNTDEAKAWFEKGVAGIFTDMVPEMIAAFPIKFRGGLV
jgi:glycerophosphoryl diester phosphodiesterase